MKKIYKGEFGYISYRKKVALLRSVICVAVILCLFFTGLFIYKSQKNIFSIVAALGCIPTGWSIVNLIMFYRAVPISENDFRRIEDSKGGLLIHYDHLITSYDKNYSVGATTVLDKNVCCYAADSFDIQDCEKHIKKMMAQAGYSNHSIKIFNDIEAFCDRIIQLDKLRAEKNIDPYAIEDAWVPGTAETPASVLLSISL